MPPLMDDLEQKVEQKLQAYAARNKMNRAIAVVGVFLASAALYLAGQTQYGAKLAQEGQTLSAVEVAPKPVTVPVSPTAQ